MGDRRAGDVYKRHLEDGLSSEDPGPTEKGEKGDAAMVPNLDECTPARDGSVHPCDVEAGLFLFEDTGVGQEGTEVGT
jgi:hypothetical protein